MFSGSSDRFSNVARQLAGERQVQLAAMRPAQVELVKLVAHNLRAPLRRAVPDELVVEKLEPAAIDLFRFGEGCGAYSCGWPYELDDTTKRAGCKRIRGQTAGSCPPFTNSAPNAARTCTRRVRRLHDLATSLLWLRPCERLPAPSVSSPPSRGDLVHLLADAAID